MKKFSKRSGGVELSSIGLDLADKNSDYAMLSTEGEVVERGRLKTSEPDLRSKFGSIRPTVIALEAGSHSRWVSRVLSSCGHRVVVANARKIALIHQNRRKTNTIDAELLARLVRADEKLLFAVEHRSEQGQRDVSVLRSRDVLVGARTKLINHVRGIAKSFGIKMPRCSTPSFVVRAGSVITPDIAAAVGPLMKHIGQMSEEIGQYDRLIEQMSDRYPAAERLRQIKGVGALTAVSYVLTVGDPYRITRSRSAGAYFGLVPGCDDSGESHLNLRITKEGDAYVRRLLVSCAQYILGPFGEDCDLRRYGLALYERGGQRAKKRAVVAVARKLAVLMHKLWISQEDYQPLFNAIRSRAAA